MHLMGALIAPAVAWDLGDIFLGIVILPNLLALVMLSSKVRESMDSYFERKPWIQNLEDHKKWVAEHKKD
jgi:AGCS family alanine or glycine:cation symporter